MVKLNESLPPFLAKLILLTQETPANIARWSPDGSVYVIVDDSQFNSVLKKFFKGSTQTFVRQLHFYGFKKVEVDKSLGVWGFQHEGELFVRDNTELVKDIKRKTKIDPDTQKLASYYEVEALKSQVSFLQRIVEDLRMSVKKLKEGKVIKKEPEVMSNKRPRTKSFEEPTDTFMDLCSKVTPPTLSRTSSFCSVGSVGSLGIHLDKDFEKYSTFLENDLELDSIPIKQEPGLKNAGLSNFDDAVETISKVTKVKRTDVSKIISFLSQLNISGDREEEKGLFNSCQSLDNLITMNVRKVGVGAS